ncbi:MAG: radical SAM protein [Peptostreptococcaceae bacterium]
MMMKNITLMISRNCNMACTYCLEGLNKQPRNMSNDVIDKSIELLQNGSEILLFGGEPFVNLYGIEHLLDELDKKGISINFYIITNGSIYNKRVQAIISRMLTKHRINTMQVSIDGDKESHDANRTFVSGGGTYDLIMENVKTMKSDFPNMRITANMVINHNVVENLFESYKSIFETGLFDSISTRIVRTNAEGYSLFNIEHFKLQLTMIYNWAKSINKVDRIMPSILDLQKERNVMGCGICKTTVLVDYNGDIYPCHFFINDRSFIMGNVFTHSMEDVAKTDIFATCGESGFMVDNGNICGECDHLGCVKCKGSNFYNTGSMNLVLGGLCDIEKVKLELKDIIKMDGIDLDNIFKNTKSCSGDCDCGSDIDTEFLMETIKTLTEANIRLTDEVESLKNVLSNNTIQLARLTESHIELNDKMTTLMDSLISIFGGEK